MIVILARMGICIYGLYPRLIPSLLQDASNPRQIRL
jgi:hypothetical protein